VLLIFLYLFLIIISILPTIFILDVLVTGKSPLVTSPPHARHAIRDLLNLNDDSIFYDLGCGTALLLTECSSRYPQVKFVGIDNSPFSYVFSKMRTKVRTVLSGRKNISIKFANFFTVDLSQATHIYLWIYVRDLDKLLTKFETELKPGTLVYSLDFPFSHKEPAKVVDLGKEHKFGHTLYVYDF
jgi:SAM-dependent methyltransferase